MYSIRVSGLDLSQALEDHKPEEIQVVETSIQELRLGERCGQVG